MLVESCFLWLESAEDSRSIGQCIGHHFKMPRAAGRLLVAFKAHLKGGVFRVKGKHLRKEAAAVVAVFEEGSGIGFLGNAVGVFRHLLSFAGSKQKQGEQW